MLLRLIIIFSLFISTIKGQNLVNNWSFEDKLNCPIGLGAIDYAIGWVNFGGSPDYYHSCSTTAGTPQNIAGYQIPRTGVAYAGFLAYLISNPTHRETIGTQLNQVLTVGVKYYVKFYVSLVINQSPGTECGLAVDKVGINLSTVPYSLFYPYIPNNISQVYSNNIITDTFGWTEISGSFIADSNYQYLSIGNFFQAQNINSVIIDPIGMHSYYFVDDICLSPDSLFCDELLNSVAAFPVENSFTIIPNPADDFIQLSLKGEGDFIIYDSIGRVSFSKNKVSNNQKLNISDLPAGVYFAVIKNSKVYSGCRFVKL